MHAPEDALPERHRPNDGPLTLDLDRPGSARPGPARLLARIRPARLDRALIAGADPAESPQLCARAARLRSVAFRRSLADGLERWVLGARTAQGRLRAVPPRDVVVADASSLLELSEILRGPPPPDARAVAISVRLLADATGSAYVASPERLKVLLDAATAAR